MDELTQRDFFFCYSERLSAFLTYKGVRYITMAKNPKTDTVYKMYYRSSKLNEALAEYKE